MSGIKCINSWKNVMNVIDSTQYQATGINSKWFTFGA